LGSGVADADDARVDLVSLVETLIERHFT
jgi:hypothetical protein